MSSSLSTQDCPPSPVLILHHNKSRKRSHAQHELTDQNVIDQFEDIVKETPPSNGHLRYRARRQLQQFPVQICSFRKDEPPCFVSHQQQQQQQLVTETETRGILRRHQNNPVRSEWTRALLEFGREPDSDQSQVDLMLQLASDAQLLELLRGLFEPGRRRNTIIFRRTWLLLVRWLNSDNIPLRTYQTLFEWLNREFQEHEIAFVELTGNNHRLATQTCCWSAKMMGSHRGTGIVMLLVLTQALKWLLEKCPRSQQLSIMDHETAIRLFQQYFSKSEWTKTIKALSPNALDFNLPYWEFVCMHDNPVITIKECSDTWRQYLSLVLPQQGPTANACLLKLRLEVDDGQDSVFFDQSCSMDSVDEGVEWLLYQSYGFDDDSTIEPLEKKRCL